MYVCVCFCSMLDPARGLYLCMYVILFYVNYRPRFL